MVSISSVQFGAAFAKDLFHYVNPLSVVWMRWFFSAVFFWIFARPQLRGRTRQDWLIVAGYSVSLVVMNTSIYLAFSRIPLGLAVTIEFLGPLAVALSQSRRLADFIWVILAGIGVTLLGFTPGSYDWIGIGFAALAAVCWAAYIALAGAAGRRWHGASGLTIATTAGAIVLAIPAIKLGGVAMATSHVLLVGFLVAIFSSVTPYALELEARRRIHAGLFGVLMSLEPAAAALAAFLVIRETMTPVEITAMICIVIASIGATQTMRNPSGRRTRFRDGIKIWRRDRNNTVEINESVIGD